MMYQERTMSFNSQPDSQRRPFCSPSSQQLKQISKQSQIGQDEIDQVLDECNGLRITRPEMPMPNEFSRERRALRKHASMHDLGHDPGHSQRKSYSQIYNQEIKGDKGGMYCISLNGRNINQVNPGNPGKQGNLKSTPGMDLRQKWAIEQSLHSASPELSQKRFKSHKNLNLSKQMEVFAFSDSHLNYDGNRGGSCNDIQFVRGSNHHFYTQRSFQDSNQSPHHKSPLIFQPQIRSASPRWSYAKSQSERIYTSSLPKARIIRCATPIHSLPHEEQDELVKIEIGNMHRRRSFADQNEEEDQDDALTHPDLFIAMNRSNRSNKSCKSNKSSSDVRQNLRNSSRLFSSSTTSNTTSYTTSTNNSSQILKEENLKSHVSCLEQPLPSPPRKLQLLRKHHRDILFYFVSLIIVASISLLALLIVNHFQSQHEHRKQNDDYQQGGISSKYDLLIPPSDLEGRCSPSNLPHSLDSCLDACRAGACCYPSYEGESCNSGYEEINHLNIINYLDATYNPCGYYRPYCDVLYDPWVGGTDGKLPPPPNHLFFTNDWQTVCMEFDFANLDILSNIYPSLYSNSNSNAAYKDNHSNSGMKDTNITNITHVASESHPPRSRTQEEPSNVQFVKPSSQSSPPSNDPPIVLSTCIEICLLARCCHAPRVPAQNHDLLQDGQYVVTSCKEFNKEYCEDYTNACLHVWESWHYWDADVSDDLFLNSSWEDISNYESNTNAESNGQSNTNNEAKVESNGQFNGESETGSNVSLNNSSNTLLSQISSQTSSQTPSQTPKENSTSPTALSETPPATYLTPTPSIPPAKPSQIGPVCTGTSNIQLISIGLLSFQTACHDACIEGLCCFYDILGPMGTFDPHGSCFDQHKETCMGYSSCLALGLNNQNSPWIGESLQEKPKEPMQDLSLVCSESAILSLDGLFECYKECQPGACCDETSHCYDDYKDICLLYEPCQIIKNQGGNNGG